jgi:hypothetical protein
MQNKRLHYINIQSNTISNYSLNDNGRLLNDRVIKTAGMSEVMASRPSLRWTLPCRLAKRGAVALTPARSIHGAWIIAQVSRKIKARRQSDSQTNGKFTSAFVPRERIGREPRVAVPVRPAIVCPMVSIAGGEHRACSSRAEWTRKSGQCVLPGCRRLPHMRSCAWLPPASRGFGVIFMSRTTATDGHLPFSCRQRL